MTYNVFGGTLNPAQLNSTRFNPFQNNVRIKVDQQILPPNWLPCITTYFEGSIKDDQMYTLRSFGEKIVKLARQAG